MKTILPLAPAALLLAACATEVRDETPGLAQASMPAIRTQTYIPGVGSEPVPIAEDRAEPARESAQTQREATPGLRPPAQRRIGSSSPPPDPATMPRMAPPTLPAPPSTTDAVNDAKRDRMRSGIDRMREEDALGRLDPIQQRDLLMRQQELKNIGR